MTKAKADSDCKAMKSVKALEEAESHLHRFRDAVKIRGQDLQDLCESKEEKAA